MSRPELGELMRSSQCPDRSSDFPDRGSSSQLAAPASQLASSQLVPLAPLAALVPLAVGSRNPRRPLRRDKAPHGPHAHEDCAGEQHDIVEVPRRAVAGPLGPFAQTRPETDVEPELWALAVMFLTLPPPLAPLRYASVRSLPSYHARHIAGRRYAFAAPAYATPPFARTARTARTARAMLSLAPLATPLRLGSLPRLRCTAPRSLRSPRR